MRCEPGAPRFHRLVPHRPAQAFSCDLGTIRGPEEPSDGLEASTASLPWLAALETARQPKGFRVGAQLAKDRRRLMDESLKAADSLRSVSISSVKPGP